MQPEGCGEVTETSKLTAEQQILVEENLNLVHYILAHKFDFHNNYEDFYQMGAYGLCLAAQRFDESKGFEFATFAASYIQGYILRQYRDFETGPIRPPRVKGSCKLDLPNYLYIDGIINENGDCYGYEFIDTGIDNEEELITSLAFQDIMSRLTQREQDIVNLSLVQCNQKQIGSQLGLTQSHISRLLDRLQEKFNKELNYEGYLHDLQRSVGRKQIHNREQLHMSTLRLENETQCNDKTRKEAKEIALYSDSEICMLYRDAKNKRNQIEIIKQLTGYSDLQIEYILKKGGCLELKDEKKAEIIEQYNKGLSDKAISREVEISQSQVSTFLRGQGLPPNGKKFPGKTEPKEIIIVPEVVEEIHETVAEVKAPEKIEKEEKKEVEENKTVQQEVKQEKQAEVLKNLKSETQKNYEELKEVLPKSIPNPEDMLINYDVIETLTPQQYYELAKMTIELLKTIWG